MSQKILLHFLSMTLQSGRREQARCFLQLQNFKTRNASVILQERNIQTSKSRPEKHYLQCQIKSIRDMDCVNPSSMLAMFSPSCPNSSTFAPHFQIFPKPLVFFNFILLTYLFLFYHHIRKKKKRETGEKNCSSKVTEKREARNV